MGGKGFRIIRVLEAFLLNGKRIEFQVHSMSNRQSTFSPSESTYYRIVHNAASDQYTVTKNCMGVEISTIVKKN